MPKTQKIGLGIFFFVMLLLPLFLDSFTQQLMITAMMLGMLALSFTHTLKVGLLRFDLPGWWAIGAYTAAILMVKIDMSFWLAALLGGIASVLVGYLIFAIAIPRGMMVFFALGMVVAMLVQQIFAAFPIFGGWAGLSNLPYPSLFGFEFISKTSLYYLGLGLLALTLITFSLLYYSRIGRAWDAIGGGMRLAKSLGIDVVRYRMLNVLIGNFFLGLLGAYYAAFQLSVIPTAFSATVSTNVMMYIIVGGMFHSMAGPLLGAALFTFIPEYTRMSEQYSPIVISVITLVIVLFFGMGLLGIVDKYKYPVMMKIKQLRMGKKPQPT